MKRLKFLLITKKNLKKAIKIAKEIFPYESSKLGIFLPEFDYKYVIKKPKLGKFFIVKFDNKLVRITGYYYNFTKPKVDEIWLGYFGIRKKFRGIGLGKKVLLKTLSLIKKKIKVKVVKLFTTNRKEEKSSHFLYRCLGFKKYAHRKTKPYQTYYFKKDLKSPVD